MLRVAGVSTRWIVDLGRSGALPGISEHRQCDAGPENPTKQLKQEKIAMSAEPT